MASACQSRSDGNISAVHPAARFQTMLPGFGKIRNGAVAKVHKKKERWRKLFCKKVSSKPPSKNFTSWIKCFTFCYPVSRKLSISRSCNSTGLSDSTSLQLVKSFCLSRAFCGERWGFGGRKLF